MKDQFLDQNPIERERGITIKLQLVRMEYVLDGDRYVLNLIDTPGHVDFSYEVSRSLAACEGVLLLVDAAQGIQAQTVANAYLAIEEGLEIIPIINKIDLPSADIEGTKKEISNLLGEEAEPFLISAKEGAGVEELLRGIIDKIPAPKKEDPAGELKALVFDSEYDPYQGILAYARIFSGEIKKEDTLYVLPKRDEFEAQGAGVFSPTKKTKESLKAGEIGYIVTGLKDPTLLRVGATLSHSENILMLPGYREPRSMVFATLFLEKGDEEFESLRDALHKLYLNDASLFFEPEQSSALGRGFRCGFLGVLHLEIVTERLKREFGLSLVVTRPTVAYEYKNGEGNFIKLHSPSEFPRQKTEFREPWTKLDVFTPARYLGKVMELLQNTEGQFKEQDYFSQDRLRVSFEAPLREIVLGFYDALKAATSGYASMSYDILGLREVDLVKLDVLAAGEEISALSELVPRQNAEKEGRKIVKRLKEVLPRQLFAVALQAAIDSKIIARETLPAMRKDVTGHLYGGDVTRKKKLLEKQKKGKKRMKSSGKVDIPQEIFIKLLK